MKKSVAVISVALSALLLLDASLVSLTGCAGKNAVQEVSEQKEDEKDQPDEVKESTSEVKEEAVNSDNTSVDEDSKENDAKKTTKKIAMRPYLLGGFFDATPENLVKPSVDEYTVNPDFSNVINYEEFSYLPESVTEKLYRNGFVVYGDAGNEFYDIYESNSYGLTPNFVTVDSLLHTYHLYFAHLQKNTEIEYLDNAIRYVTANMLEASKAQHDELVGTKFEDAAVRNVEFFAVAAGLLMMNADIPDYAADVCHEEMDKINSYSGQTQSLITGEYEDYSQYRPRGYYEGNPLLEQYFKAMMWYGRTHFVQKNEDLDRSALLMTLALDGEAFSKWESVYTITAFFAGASDDNGYYEYRPVIENAYGEINSIKDIADNEEAWKSYHEATAELKPPVLNSCVIDEGDENVILGYRFMGQRFTIDGEIMQHLIYRDVEENEKGEKRLLPDALDVPAALGSDTALDIASSQGAKDFPDYAKNMAALRSKYIDSDSDPVWTSSLGASWLYMLKPLTAKKQEGYPEFMMTTEWAKKNLETFLGSYTELKHDTILYAKQMMAEMGGGWEEEVDDRGYVEPEVEVYSRFAALSLQTAEGLKSYGMLTAEDEENLSRLTQMAKTLMTISHKELVNELPTQEEFDFIRDYGGFIEHLFIETVKDEVPEGDDSNWITSQLFPAAIVVDIATNPNGEVLEIAEGEPGAIYVIVPVDGILRVARGSVYSFYQFTQPIDERLTDSEWRQMMGITQGEDGMFDINNPNRKERPSWTQSYREDYDTSNW